MRILHLISSMDRGGAESHLASLARIQNKKDNVTIVYFKGNNYWKSNLKKEKINIIRLNLKSKFIFFQLIELIFKINDILKKVRPNILHCHLSMMELVGAILRKVNNQKFKFIITKHLDSAFLEGSKGKKVKIKGFFFDKFIINTANKTICISKQVKNFFIKNTHLPKKKFVLIYYGFDFKNFKKNRNFKSSNEFKVLKKIPRNNFKICCVARHVNQKSLDFLIISFSKYLSENNKSNLILVGSGPETNNLMKLAKKLNISRKIIWIKFSENVRDIIEFSDTFILTSEYEGLGLVLLEAMAANKPIIASNTSAIPEVIKHNFNGFLIKHLNKKDLVQKLKLIQNKNIRNKFILNSKTVLHKKFNLKIMINKTQKYYYE